MNLTNASATPSTSGKRIQSEGNDRNSTSEDNPPKKKRKSAIRSRNNLKMLIQNKQLHYFPKQKVSPKKVLSLRKEARTETLETLISTGNFNKLEKLYTKTVASESLGSIVNYDTVSTDDSDSNNKHEAITLPDTNILKPAPKNAPIHSSNNLKLLKQNKQLHYFPKQKVSPKKVLSLRKEARNETLETLISTGNFNQLEKLYTKTVASESLGSIVNYYTVSTDDSDSNNEHEAIPLPDTNILKPVPKNVCKPTKQPGSLKTLFRETVIATSDSDSINEPDVIPTSDKNILKSVPKNTPNPTKHPGRSKTLLREIVTATSDSDSNNEPEIITSSDRNTLELVSKSDPNKSTQPERSKTPLCETVIAIDNSDSSNEAETITPPDRNILKNISKIEHNKTNSTKNPVGSKIPPRETVDSDPTQITSTNNLDQLKETTTSHKIITGIQSSFIAEVSTLQKLIHNLAPEIGTDHQNIVDIKHIEDIYNSILEVKSKMTALYQEKSVQLRKAFECINFFVPEIKEGLPLPTIQQLKENIRPNSNILKTVSSRQEQPSPRKGRTPCLQQSELSSDSESLSQSPNPSTSSKSNSKCSSYVVK